MPDKEWIDASASVTVAWPNASMTGDELADLKRRFEREIFPLLTPLAVDPGHPLPFLPSLSVSLAVVVREPDGGDARLALVQLPDGLSTLVSVGQRGVDVPVKDAVLFFLPRLFPRMDILERSFFRVTRVVDGGHAAARRGTRVARLDMSEPVSERLLTRLAREFGIGDEHVHIMQI